MRCLERRETDVAQDDVSIVCLDPAIDAESLQKILLLDLPIALNHVGERVTTRYEEVGRPVASSACKRLRTSQSRFLQGRKVKKQFQ